MPTDKPQLKFFTNQQRDVNLLVEFFVNKKFTPQNHNEIRARICTGGAVNKMKAKLYVNNTYKLLGPYIKKSARLYQNSWDEINASFFKLLVNKTAVVSSFSTYRCHVSAFFPGRSSWGGSTITRGWWENPYTMRKITAHETIIAYLWYYLRKTFPENTTQKNWKLAELTAWVMLSYDKEFLKFWPWFIDKGGLQNYPEISGHIAYVKKIYMKEKKFNDFLLDLNKMKY